MHAIAQLDVKVPADADKIAKLYMQLVITSGWKHGRHDGVLATTSATLELIYCGVGSRIYATNRSL